MMTNNMKAYELSEMEMNNVTGGNNHDTVSLAEKVHEMIKEQKTEGPTIHETISNAAGTAWEVVKHVLSMNRPFRAFRFPGVNIMR